jgi:hypothetical protein
MKPQKSITSFFSLTEEIIETTVPSEYNEETSIQISKTKQYDFN